MPREDTLHLANPSAHKAAPGPLKRGDACLYCRKRRIKCNAEKPVCGNCMGKRECVYDSGKPVSRVKQLEDKVQQLEGLLKSGAIGPGTSSTEPPPLAHHSSSDMTSSSTHSFHQSPPNVNGHGGTGGAAMFDPSVMQQMQSFFNNGTGLDAFGSESNNKAPLPDMFSQSNDIPTFEAFSRVDQNAVDSFDFSTLDPNFMDLVSSFGATSTAQPSLNPAGMDVDPFGGQSTGLTPFLDPTGGQGLGGQIQNPFMPPVPPVQPQPVSMQQTPNSVLNSQSTWSSSTSNIGSGPSPLGSQQHSRRPTIEDELDPISRNHGQQNVFGMTGQGSVTLGSLPVPKEQEDGNGSWAKWRTAPNEVPELGDNLGLVGGWFDAADLPKVARDHLLDLFFSSMRMFGQEFHIPRFFASLSLPAAKRPHPCLLYTMYLMASRITTSMPIRSLESHFYAIATKKLEESIAHADRLFDAVRAITILAVYKYSLAKYHEGWMMTGQAARLAISCGLHAIPTSVWKQNKLPKDHRADLIGLMRQRAWVIPPPADAVELGERIWAFWSAFTVERCGSIAAQWPPSISDEIITTPYPRPLYEYELGLINDADDTSISSLYDPTPRPPMPFYADSTYIHIRMRAMAILERASKLIYLKPEPGWEQALRETSSTSPPSLSSASVSPPNWAEDVLSSEQYLAMFGQSPQARPDSRRGSADKLDGKGWMRTAKIRTPKAYEEVLRALQQVEQDMPPERRTNWESWDGNVQSWHFGGKGRKDLVTLHFLLGCSWMFLFDVFSFNALNDKAVGVARRLSFTVKMVMQDQMTGDLDVFMPMTWSFIVKVLIREVKRLVSTGDVQGASSINADIEACVQALNNVGSHHGIAAAQARRMNEFRQSTAEDTKFLEDEDYDPDEHGEMPQIAQYGPGGQRVV